jgi:DNA protecting protein DprA
VQNFLKQNHLNDTRNLLCLLYTLEQHWSVAKVRRAISSPSFWEKVAPHASVEPFANWTKVATSCFAEIPRSYIHSWMKRAKKHSEFCQVNNFRVVTPADAEYPKNIDWKASGALQFSVCGPDLGEQVHKVGIVGTRKPSLAGVKIAFQLGRHLASEGCDVFSGGAYGCDIAAHRGALDCKLIPARTSVVFPSGLAKLRPKGLTRSYEHIKAAGGRWFSPFFYDHEPKKYDYLKRNHFLASLVDELYVIEAPIRSGSMSTAIACGQLGVPVKVWSPNGILPAGNASLLQEHGAEPFRIELEQGPKPSREQTIHLN